MQKWIEEMNNRYILDWDSPSTFSSKDAFGKIVCDVIAPMEWSEFQTQLEDLDDEEVKAKKKQKNTQKITKIIEKREMEIKVVFIDKFKKHSKACRKNYNSVMKVIEHLHDSGTIDHSNQWLYGLFDLPSIDEISLEDFDSGWKWTEQRILKAMQTDAKKHWKNYKKKGKGGGGGMFSWMFGGGYDDGDDYSDDSDDDGGNMLRPYCFDITDKFALPVSDFTNLCPFRTAL